jgi:hypothetical protein
VEAWLLSRLESGRIAPDLAVVDPPRQGLTGVALERLVACKPKALRYVSCGSRLPHGQGLSARPVPPHSASGSGGASVGSRVGVDRMGSPSWDAISRRPWRPASGARRGPAPGSPGARTA